ncbi:MULTISPECIES: hypothetical protein [Streptomyces]|jgi:hypothetical protein|uniref:DUF378 domain-containing protein n=1 Tax=Streptomyces doudnae TaxID=3075536 RepID=A0ABD5EPJ1_9ACTN|nr:MULTISPECIES: hypothetical protein [unclassified Streptomyces]MDT0436182.1 hypothetical protein [Streptomyces sp. DSM 41981]MYQ68953.1 hypothetical protein [Streptomyces sp. SID4950]SCE50313.1 hypothetical protein GA0115242_142612 [Streptomyces sp. SolWspMP-5a-2]
MKRLLEIAGLVALAQGALGLLHEVTGWETGVVHRLGFLDGKEVYANVTLLVLAFALFAAAGSRKTR